MGVLGRRTGGQSLRLHPDLAAAVTENIFTEVCICFTSHTACDCAAEEPKVYSTCISSALEGQSLRLCMTAEHVSAACTSLLHACFSAWPPGFH